MKRVKLKGKPFFTKCYSEIKGDAEVSKLMLTRIKIERNRENIW